MDAFDEDAFVIRRSMRILGAAATVVILGAAAGRVGGLRRARALGRVGRPRRAGVRLGPQPRRRARGRYACEPTRAGSRPTESSCCPPRGSSADGCSRGRMRRLSCTSGGSGPATFASSYGTSNRDARCCRRSRIDASHVSADFWAMARPLGEPRTFAHVALLLALTVAVGIVVGPAVPPVFAVAGRRADRPLRGRRRPDPRGRRRRRRSAPLAGHGALRAVVDA